MSKYAVTLKNFLASGAAWIFVAKSLSALFVMVQAWTFSRFLPDNQTQDAFYYLAIISCIGQAALATPSMLVAQYAWLPPNEQIQKYRFCAYLFTCSVVALYVVWQLLPLAPTDPLTTVLIMVVACFAAIPNLFSIERYAIGAIKHGVIYNCLNLIIPQIVAQVLVFKFGNAVYWLIGLAIGHFAALLLITVHRVYQPPETRMVGAREALRFNSTLLLNTLIWLSFVWVLPNLPRLALADVTPSSEVSQLLVIGSIAFAVGNALETSITQLRRKYWLQWFEQPDQVDCLTSKISREFFRIALVVFGLLGPLAALLYFVADIQLFSASMSLSFSAIGLLVLCELLRVMCSIAYLIGEAARAQAVAVPWIALCAIGSTFILFRLDDWMLTEVYSALAVLLTVAAFATTLQVYRKIADIDRHV